MHLHFTPYWALARGSGCVAPDGNAIRLTVRRAGEVQLVTRFSLDRIGATAPALQLSRGWLPQCHAFPVAVMRLIHY